MTSKNYNGKCGASGYNGCPWYDFDLPIKIASHSERLSKYLRHETLFLGSVVAYWYKLCSL